MISTIKTRRAILKQIFASICGAGLLTGCDFGKNKVKEFTEPLTGSLRHHGVAAHLGRLAVETDPQLQSLNQEQLASEILARIGLDINTMTSPHFELIKQQLSDKIRQDFADETVTTVDGWLLSQTEIQVCALIFRQLQTANA